MTDNAVRQAVVVGASSGIGAATARTLVDQGWSVHLGARRIDRLRELAGELTESTPAGSSVITTGRVDVTDSTSVDTFAAQVAGPVDVLIYSAGLALGSDAVARIDNDEFAEVMQTSVGGLTRIMGAFMPRLRHDPATTVAVVTSMSGHATGPGGGSYAAAKHAQVALVDTLRAELQGRNMRVVEISPGAVSTEFALVKARGDAEAAASSQARVVPLGAAEVADCIAWAVSRPASMEIRALTVAPRLRM